MNQFYMFRLKLPSKSRTLNLFDIRPSEMLAKLILKQPEALVRSDILWVIANAERISSDVVYFKFGRAVTRVGERYDKGQRSFVPAEIEIANCAQCLFDISTQILSIEKVVGCPSVFVLSAYIRRVLKQFIERGDLEGLSPEEVAYIKTREPEIGNIADPVDFIAEIKSAVRVLEYRIDFSRSNPIDFDELLQKPFGNIMTNVGADLGCAILKASKDTLQADELVDLTRGAASAGDNVSAKIQRTDRSLADRIFLKKKETIARIDVEDGTGVDWLLSLAAAIRSKYRDIHG